MDYRLAEFVRFIEVDEDFEEVLNEAKADTWSKAREHAVLILDNAEVVMVRGGRDGILLIDRGEEGIFVEVESKERRVQRLSWHTHPAPTGPSDHDRELLVTLGQSASMLYELRGDPAGTRFAPKAR
jgi:hypothetical protein